MIPEPACDILLITVDQWRGDLVGRGPLALAVPTPHLDALAGEATRFARHFTTAYPCGPARASLITGLYAHKHRSIRNGTPLDARHPTLFQEARRAGYRPRLFGYTDTTLDPRGRSQADPDLREYESVAPGIEVDTLLIERATPWLAHLAAKGYPVPDPDAGRAGIFAQRFFPEPALFAAEDSETAFLTDRFLAWLRVAGREKFFAHLSLIAPHPPFSAAAPYQDMIDPARLPPPIRGLNSDVEAAQHPLIAPLLDRMDLGDFVPGLNGRPDRAAPATIAKIRAIYAGQAHEVDRHLGRVVQALRDAGRWDTTLIVFTADHGEQLFDHWMLGKAGYFDQSAHVPLIIRDPRPGAAAGRGRIVEAFTESVDVMPTILCHAGLAVPRNVDGRDLLPFCAGETPARWRDEVHWSYDFRDLPSRFFETSFGIPSEWCNLQVVRGDAFKYVHFAGLPPVLFDLAEDPEERVNRAEDPAARGLRIEAMDRLLSFRQRFEERTLTGFLAAQGGFIEEHPGATRGLWRS